MIGTEKQIAWANEIISKLRECCDLVINQGKNDRARAMLAKGADAVMAHWAEESNNRADFYIALFGDITKRDVTDVESGWNIRGRIVAEAKKLMSA